MHKNPNTKFSETYDIKINLKSLKYLMGRLGDIQYVESAMYWIDSSQFWFSAGQGTSRIEWRVSECVCLHANTWLMCMWGYPMRKREGGRDWVTGKVEEGRERRQKGERGGEEKEDKWERRLLSLHLGGL